MKIRKLIFVLGYKTLKYSEFKLRALFAFASRVLYNAKAQALLHSQVDKVLEMIFLRVKFLSSQHSCRIQKHKANIMTHKFLAYNFRYTQIYY